MDSHEGHTIYLDDRRTLVVGKRRWPVALSEAVDTELPGVLFRTRHALVAFESGWAVSVIYGTGTYSDNYAHDAPTFIEQPREVEVALFNRGAMVSEPMSYVQPARLNAILDRVAEWPSKPLPEVAR